MPDGLLIGLPRLDDRELDTLHDLSREQTPTTLRAPYTFGLSVTEVIEQIAKQLSEAHVAIDQPTP